MNVRVKLEISTRGMARGNDGWKEMSLIRPGKHCFSRGRKKAAKQESALVQKLPQLRGDGKTDVTEAGAGEVFFDSFHPLVGKNFTTRVTEAGFAGMRHDNVLVRVLRTGIFMITQLGGITACEHFVDRANDIMRKRVAVLGQIGFPMIFEDLSYGKAVGTQLA